MALWSILCLALSAPSVTSEVAPAPDRPETEPSSEPDADEPVVPPPVVTDAAPDESPPDEPAAEPSVDDTQAPAESTPSPSFFNDETTTAPEPVAPPMPEIEELPQKQGAPPEPRKRKVFDTGAADRPPAGADGGSFFDPGKLADVGPSGGAIQIRGFVAANFFLAQRSNTFDRTNGSFRQLKTLPYFDVSSATLYVGAPIFADVVYARIGFEFLSAGVVPPAGVDPSISGQTRRFVAFETGALEINPFALAEKTPRWFREGFKITAGIFILPFGLEDEDHAAPVNWFITRPLAMTNNRVYPGTWSDVGASLKWKPTFRSESPIRPIEIDVGIVNGDACSQTRFLDTLFADPALVPSCERTLRDGETDESEMLQAGTPRINAPGGFILPDNNAGKSVVARVQAFPIGSINLGGSVVWGTHPPGDVSPGPGESSADFKQAASWRVGSHLELNFEEMFESKVPLPMLRGEFVFGRDDAVDRAAPTLTDRRMRGGYAQIAQPLFRRKKTRLPGLILQYRFDQADPDLAVPSVVAGFDPDGNPVDVDLVSDLSSTRRESAFQSHTVGFRFPVLPRFTLKAEYTFAREDGGAANQLANDVFGIEAVADF
ncbi:MAG: hypothetical protein ACRBN8_22855 [Nannocystales bacterium]